MMKMIKKRKKYCALGFVELIISIGVAAIALVVLMNMASNSMKEAIRHERHDALTRLAMDGALVVRRHVERANDIDYEGDISFDGEEGNCYVLNSLVDFDISLSFDPGSPDLPSFGEDFESLVIYDQEGERNLGDTYYLGYCISSVSEIVEAGVEKKVYVGKIIAEYADCSGCNVAPYEYEIIVSTKEYIVEP
jgi:hypothetical protein